MEYQIVIGDSPPGLIAEDLRKFADPAKFEVSNTVLSEDETGGFWKEGEIHRLSTESYVWTFSLIYRGGEFDVIKWKTSFAWKEIKHAADDKERYMMKKDLFIGAIAGIFFLSIDENIEDNFSRLADMMDTFLEKTKGHAPFLVYGLIENKEKIRELKINKELLKNLADVKKWVSMNNGIFKLENLTELKMNMMHFINEYTHHVLTHFREKTEFKNLRLGEVHQLDYEDLSALKEIEVGLEEMAEGGATVDEMLSNMLFDLLKRPEFQEEPITPPVAEAEVEERKEPAPPPPTQIKKILEEIRLGIRRQCPKCFNKDRNKIFEELDKENIIMKNPNIYGFKYRCGMCGHEWKTHEYEWKNDSD